MTAQTSKRSLNRSDALPAAVHHNSHQVVHAVQVDGVSGRVEEAQLQRENDAVGQLGVAVQLVHVLEPLEVQRQDHGQLLHPHPGEGGGQGRGRGGMGERGVSVTFLIIHQVFIVY